ncbi:hypothetical protein GCM10009772_08200 [Pseudonocardia alni subsp. carboxydivorans]
MGRAPEALLRLCLRASGEALLELVEQTHLRVSSCVPGEFPVVCRYVSDPDGSDAPVERVTTAASSHPRRRRIAYGRGP